MARWSDVPTMARWSDVPTSTKETHCDKMNWEGDCKKALKFIEEHELRDKIITMYIHGPPEDKGFSWWQNDTPEFSAMHGFILAMDYDSSAYAVMHRKIQESIRDMYHLTGGKIVRLSDNQKVIRIWGKDGVETAVMHMVKEAGGDYGKMRSMFG